MTVKPMRLLQAIGEVIQLAEEHQDWRDSEIADKVPLLRGRGDLVGLILDGHYADMPEAVRIVKRVAAELDG